MLRPLLLLSLLLALPSYARPSCPRSRPAAKFSAEAMRGKTEQQRLVAYVEACAQPRVLEVAKSLIRFKTVSAEQSADKHPEFAKLEKYLSGFAKRHGLTFRTVGQRDVFELGLGEGEPRLGLVFHADVVPAPAHEWSHPPFVPRVTDGKLHGRGAEDDKGAIAAAMVTLAMAKELGLRPQGKVLVILGNGEESDWAGMQRYVKSEPTPRHVISVDSGFPVITAQSGFVSWHLDAALEDPATDAGPPPGAMARPVDVRAGEFLTQVPGQASLTLKPLSLSAVELARHVKEAAAALKRSRPSLEAKVALEKGQVVLTTSGKAVHSSGADKGHNALWDLAAVAKRLSLQPNGISAVLSVVADRFDQDHWGKKLGVAYEDAQMGGVLVAPTVLRHENGRIRLSVNMRRPPGKDSPTFRKLLAAAAASITEQSGGRIREASEPYVGEPHRAELEGPLVTTLLDIYRRRRGEANAEPSFIRGGTYARLFPGAVDFGPSFPGAPYTGHGPNEWISLSELQVLTQLLAEAMHALAF